MFTTRRNFLYGLSSSLGAAAFTDLLAAESAPLAPKSGHHAAKAKRCIFVYLAGGPSHIDTFDPKPALDKLHGKGFEKDGKFKSAMESGKRRYVASPFGFRQVGESGLWMCDRYQHLAEVADELCIYKGCQAESVNHPTANLHMNTGNRFGGDPASAPGSPTVSARSAGTCRASWSCRTCISRRAAPPTGRTATCRHTSRARRCGPRARRSSTWRRRRA